MREPLKDSVKHGKRRIYMSVDDVALLLDNTEGCMNVVVSLVANVLLSLIASRMCR